MYFHKLEKIFTTALPDHFLIQVSQEVGGEVSPE